MRKDLSANDAELTFHFKGKSALGIPFISFAFHRATSLKCIQGESGVGRRANFFGRGESVKELHATAFYLVGSLG